METGLGADVPQAAERPGPRKRHHRLRIGFVLHAVADRQLHAVLPAGVDHRARFGRVHRHRLLAPYVLARGGRAQGERLVQVVGQHDVDDVDVGVLDDTIEACVVVHVAIGNAVSPLPLRRLRGRAGDDAGQAAVLRRLQRGGQQVAAVVTQTDQGDAERSRTLGVHARHHACQTGRRQGAQQAPAGGIVHGRSVVVHRGNLVGESRGYRMPAADVVNARAGPLRDARRSPPGVAACRPAPAAARAAGSGASRRWRTDG